MILADQLPYSLCVYAQINQKGLKFIQMRIWHVVVVERVVVVTRKATVVTVVV